MYMRAKDIDFASVSAGPWYFWFCFTFYFI